MKNKFLLLSVFFMLVAVSVYGQRSLEIKDVTTDLQVFSGKDTEAGIVISCPANIALTFESSHDKVVDVYNKEQKGEEMFYYLRFNTGKKYRGRKLTVITADYAPLTIMAELNPKELKQYQLLDPDVEFVYGCYYEYRKRGTDFFQKSMYAEAKEQYSIAQECSDCPVDANLDELIANVDSIIAYQKRADEAYELLDYTTASELYGKILVLNPSDTNASDKRFNSARLYDTDCKKYFDTAELYRESGEYEKALDLYNKVVSQNCSNALLASEQAKRIGILLQSRKQRARVFALETGFKGNYGFSYGTYKNRKAGGYITLNANVEHAIKAAQQEEEDCIGKTIEGGLSFGWTFCPVPQHPYVWIFLGPGYAGAGQYVPLEGKKNDEGGQAYSFHWGNAAAVEGGLLGKIGPAVLRYTFQYRIPFGDLSKDIFEGREVRHRIGIGICF